MDLSVSQEDLAKVVQNLRELLRDHVLPRLSDLEEEVRLLRRITWPVCQSIKEGGNQLSDIKCKKEFLSRLQPEEVEFILRQKSKGLLSEELTLINHTSL